MVYNGDHHEADGVPWHNHINNTDEGWLESFEEHETRLIVKQVIRVTFPLLGLLSAGIILLIFILQTKLRKHSSMVLIFALLHVFFKAISVIIFRGPKSVEEISQFYCAVTYMVPEYWKIVLLVGLPLLSIERLIRFQTRQFMSLTQRRQLFGCLLVVTYTISLVICILPTTQIFDASHNVMCRKSLIFGDSFAYMFMSVSAASFTLTVALIVAIFIKLVDKRKQLKDKPRKMIGITQTTRAELALTLALLTGLIPCTAIRTLKLMCGSYKINHPEFCDHTIMSNTTMVLGLIHKILAYLSPLLYLVVHTRLRQKVWRSFHNNKNRKEKNHSSSSIEETTTTQASSSSSRSLPPGLKISIITSKRSSFGSVSSKIQPLDLDESDFITITNDLPSMSIKTSKSSPSKQESQKRGYEYRRSRSPRHTKTLADMVDVLSVISEQSELGDYDSVTHLSMTTEDDHHETGMDIITPACSDSEEDEGIEAS